MKHTIKICNPVWATANIELVSIIKPLLSFKAEYWRQGIKRKERKTYDKCLMKKSGGKIYFWTGLIEMVVGFCAEKNVEVDVQYMEPFDLTIYEAELPGITFRDDQVCLINTLLDNLRGILVSFTGSGKTVLGFGCISGFENIKVLWLCHTKDLVMQAYEEGKKFGFNMGRYGAGFKEIDADVVCATRQSFKNIADEYGHLFDMVVVDECFVKGTRVNTPNGYVKIENVKTGDLVYSENGTNRVTHVFRNKIELGKLSKVTLSNGCTIFCTENHLFKIGNNWIKAKDTVGNYLHTFPSGDMMSNITLSKVIKHETVHDLQSTFCSYIEKSKNLCRMFSSTKMRNLREGVYKPEQGGEILFSEVLWEKHFRIEQVKTERCLESVPYMQTGVCRHNKVLLKRLWLQKSGKKGNKLKNYVQDQHRKKGHNIRKDEEGQPVQNAGCERKSTTNKKIKWYSFCFEKRWKRERADRASEIVGNSFGMGNGSCHIRVGEDSKLPHLLQTGCRKQGPKNRGRSEWLEPHHSGTYGAGSEKERLAQPVWVESVEFYKPGDNDESFKCVVSDQEISQGFITLYDLEVENDHSYFVEGVLVHNCHHMSCTEYVYVLEKVMAPIRLGLTATLPKEGESYLTAVGLLGPVLEELTINQGTELGILAVPKIKLLRTTKDHDIAYMRNYQEVYDAAVVNRKERNDLIAKTAKAHIDKGDTVLILINRIEHGENIMQSLQELGASAMFVRGATKDTDRMTIKKDLDSGKTQCVVASTVWVEGLNIRNLNVVIIAGAGKSEIRTMQMIGRGLRKTATKDECTVYDVFDNTNKYLIEHFAERLMLYIDNGWL